MATKKTAREGKSRAGGRPRMPSSHEKVLEGSTPKRRPGSAALRTRRVPPVPGAEPVRRPREAKVTPRATDESYSLASAPARATATAIAVAALDKKAVGVEILDVAGKVDYADFLVVMTGRSDRHAQALAQGIEEALKQQGSRPVAVEGLPHGTWVLMDYGDVVVHVFQEDSRRLYDIEGLWLDAARLPVPKDDPTEA